MMTTSAGYMPINSVKPAADSGVIGVKTPRQCRGFISPCVRGKYDDKGQRTQTYIGTSVNVKTEV